MSFVGADRKDDRVESDSDGGLRRGLQGVAIRVAKAIDRPLGRHGRVWSDRCHAHALETPREVRNALVYVLANWRKHRPGGRGLDPRASGHWFTGWETSAPPAMGRAPVATARTWLARVGWRRHALIDPDEAPRRRGR